jgi:hypothetical protein
MYRFILFCTFLVLSFRAEAQLKEGSFMVGSLASHNIALSGNTTNTYSFSPEVGYMIEDFLLVGVGLSFYKAHGTTTVFLPDGTISFIPFDFYGKSFSPYIYGIKARKSNPNSYFYGGLNGLISNSFDNSIRATANLQGGMYYFVNANIAINAYTQLQAYQYSSNASSTSSNRSFFSSLYFGTSMSLFLNTNKTENKAFDGRSLFKKGNAPAHFSFAAYINRPTSRSGLTTSGYQWLSASYSKEFFVQNNLSLSIGGRISADYQSFSQRVISFPTTLPGTGVRNNELSFSVTPSVGIHYYYPLSARTFLQTGASGHYTLRRKETISDPGHYFYTGVYLGLGYFVAPNLVLSPSISYNTAQYSQNSTSKNLYTSLGFSYRMNNTRWWK